MLLYNELGVPAPPLAGLELLYMLTARAGECQFTVQWAVKPFAVGIDMLPVCRSQPPFWFSDHSTQHLARFVCDPRDVRVAPRAKSE